MQHKQLGRYNKASIDETLGIKSNLYVSIGKYLTFFLLKARIDKAE